MQRDIWASVREGEIYAVVGERVPTPSADWRVVRVRCAGPRAAMRPLRDAIAQIDRRVGQQAVFERTARRVRRGLRDHLLGEVPDRGVGDLVHALNRLERGAIIIENIEHADPDTLAVLQRIAARPGWLRPALLLCTEHPPAEEDPVAALLAAATPLAVGDEPAEPEPAFDLAALPSDARRVLRAAAVIGAGFDAETLAALLDAPLLRTLEALQAARDAGAPLEDLGEGRLQLSASLVEALRGELMPSLAAAYNRRLATLLTPEPAAPAPEPLPPIVEEDAEEPLFHADTVDVEAEVVGAAPQPQPPREVAEEAVVDVEPLEDDFDDIVPPEREEPLPPGDGVGLDDALEQGTGAAASAHLGRAGALQEATAAWLAAAEAADPLALIDTVAHGEALLRLLAESDLGADRLAAVQVQAALGRLKLEGCSPQGCYRISDALEVLEAARDAAEALPDVPAPLLADIDARIAMALYDRGEGEDLERALDALTTAIRLLMGDGRSLEAARLLNEQAAIWVRLGDPVRAAGLLKKSRAIFSEHSDTPAGAVELAETYHLLARLPLHVAARAGSQKEAISAALSHAHDARRIYARHHLRREAARVRETAGRLHLRAGDLRRAADDLSAAMGEQERLGDAQGLARTTDALAELLGRAGRGADAASLLATSIRLNFARGSAYGLAYNRKTLAMLETVPDGGPAITALARMLDRSEAVLRG